MKKDFALNDAFADYCGIELIDIGEGYAKTRLTLNATHLNGLKMPHGAALFALADVAFAAAANYGGVPTVAINVTISYLKVAESKTIYAEARELRPDGRIGSYRVTISDETGQSLAVFEGLGYRKFPPKT
jgi:acyl-CoA thioesterase